MSDRHDKWVPVEPGTVIPAGQTYWVPFRNQNGPTTVPHEGEDEPPYIVDSSWRPPLELPETPTWGIAVVKNGIGPIRAILKKWRPNGPRHISPSDGDHSPLIEHLADFIPLTPEQVARIEGAR